MPQPEAKFKAHLKEGFEEFYKDHPSFYLPIVASMMQMSGVPDIMLAAENKSAWVEAKANGGWLRPTQQVVIPRMVAAGLRVVIVSADMEQDKKDRTISFSDFSGTTLRRDRMFFRWDALNQHLFWRTVLGIYV